MCVRAYAILRFCVCRVSLHPIDVWMCVFIFYILFSCVSAYASTSPINVSLLHFDHLDSRDLQYHPSVILSANARLTTGSRSLYVGCGCSWTSLLTVSFAPEFEVTIE
jgi:hypothetical protein